MEEHTAATPPSPREMPQWERRLRTVFAIYCALMWGEFDLRHLATDFSLNANQLRIVEFVRRNLPKMVQIFEQKMHETWLFSQLNYVDQAILLESLAEKHVLKTDKKILIDQAVITSKKYSDDHAYQFINGILDQVL